jgi:hypothetical protein
MDAAQSRFAESVPQGLKPASILLAFAARLKSCPDYKAKPESSFSAAWEAVPFKVTHDGVFGMEASRFPMSQKRDMGHPAIAVRRRHPQELKPASILLAFAARLKSCPDYKAKPESSFPQPVKSRRFCWLLRGLPPASLRLGRSPKEG